MAKIFKEFKEMEYITLSEIYELSEDEDNLLEVWEMDDKFCEISKEAYDETYNLILRSAPEIQWEELLSVPETSEIDKEKVQSLLKSLNPALLMTVPKIIFLSNDSEYEKVKAFANDNEQWEEDSADWLYDYIEQFVIINIEDHRKTTSNKDELNSSLITALFAGILDGFYTNKLYNDAQTAEFYKAEKESLLKEIKEDDNFSILK